MHLLTCVLSYTFPCYFKFNVMNYSNFLPRDMVGKFFSGNISSHENFITQVISVEPNGGGFLVTHHLNGHIKKTALSVFRLRFPFINDPCSRAVLSDTVTVKSRT